MKTKSEVGSPEWLEEFFNAAKKTAILIGEEFGEGHLGGHMHLCENPSGKMLRHQKIGQPTEEELKSTFAFSEEKNVRAMRHPNHVSSYQSRDPNKGRWGGQIKTSTLGISISGYPEPVDQAFGLSLAVYFSLLSYDEACWIAMISGRKEHSNLFGKVFLFMVHILRT